MELKFRTLYANEIDCRIQSVYETGLVLLLYKDARVDQKLLDEVVGPMNWQKKYLRDNANCIVSIYDDEKKYWVEKEDTGTESNTEKEKGLASDSFKRACFNWGIGRELYSAPLIWITSDNCTIVKIKDPKTQKDKFICKDKFKIQTIDYDKNREISKLSIINLTLKKCVYNFEIKVAKEDDKVIKATPQQVEELKKIYVGDNLNKLLQANNITKIEDLELNKASEIIKRIREKRSEKQ